MSRKATSAISKTFIYLAAIITLAALFLIIGSVFVKGIPYLNLDMFSLEYSTENLSMMPAILNTLIMVLLAILIAGPVGIITAIYMNEYTSANSRVTGPIRLTSQTLAGIPSIVYGLFGNIFFVTFLGWKYSILAGACTLAIMILPTIMTSTEEALLSIDNSQREGAYALGAMKLRTVFRIILPPAIPGILAGIVLSIGRIVGETAALLYTAGSAPNLPNDLLSSGRTLAVHMYVLTTEALYKNQAFASGVILLIMVFIINIISTKLADMLSERSQNG